MQQEPITTKKRMQDMSAAEQAATIADMETIIEADATQRADRAAQLAKEKQWQNVRISLNPRAYAYVKSIAKATGKPIRRVCTDIVQAEAEAHIDDYKGAN